jgi:hypothetical protein
MVELELPTEELGNHHAHPRQARGVVGDDDDLSRQMLGKLLQKA